MYLESPVPTVSKILEKSQTTGSVHNKNYIARKQCSQITNLKVFRHCYNKHVYPVGSAQKTTKLIYFHPYKVTVVHELMLDYGERASACLARTSSKT
jgi:hypothetical protein